MKVLFIRHKFDSTNEILEKMWNEGIIGVHYENSWSTNPEDYPKKSAQRVLKLLWKCCNSGALVGADFKEIRPTTMLLGIIEPDSKVIAKKYGDYIYKTVKLKKTREISYFDWPILEAIQPRQTTFCRWRKAQALINSIWQNQGLSWDVQSLHPSQLEVLCYEYLRSERLLNVLLMPIGRTFRDVDIIGLNKHGNNIFAQITHSTNPNVIRKKRQKLQCYKTPNSTLFFFGPKAQGQKIEEGIKYIPIEDVFDTLTSKKSSVYYKMVEQMLNYNNIQRSSNP